MIHSNDAFSGYAPIVNLLFFLGALVMGMAWMHPAYVCLSLVGSLAYLLSLTRKNTLRTLGGFFLLFFFVSLINPLLNTSGEHILFTVFSRPYTLEALIWGMCVAAMLLSLLAWFRCFNLVLTGDKLTALSARVSPSLSLLFVMILRLVPSYRRKAAQLAGVRRSIGLAPCDDSTLRERFAYAGAILSHLTSWALEGAVITADSMRARGYGAAKRTSFLSRRLQKRDILLLVILFLLALGAVLPTLRGCAAAEFTPQLRIAPLAGTGGYFSAACCACYLLIPTLLNLWEALQWHSFKSKL